MIISTYAWFIGMKTVKVDNFDIDIATTEGLFLSMDGTSWTYNLNVAEAPQYTGNTNTWAPDGLTPVSSIGTMDATSSRMTMYEKGSLTTTKGGYRLLTSKVPNDVTEQTGYVAFDLFVKNLSGEAYYTDNSPLNEEAIYLKPDSTVKVATAGGTDGTGIEDSVRVAFAEVGRVSAEDGIATTANITSITCSDVASADGQAQVTGICRNAYIWEPNDTKHTQNAINWYDTACRTRKTTGTDVNLAASYNTDTHCRTVNTINTSDTPTPTYAISRTLGVDDNVDIYDGVYNTYTGSTDTYANYITAISGKTGTELTTALNSFKLVNYPYFTDTDKLKTGNEREQFMSLAPNSITKVRVYIYIEGQDIDNYDFASLGKKISINFGFTKERYNETDINYVGPDTGTTSCPSGQYKYGNTCVTMCPEGYTQDSINGCVADNNS